MTRYRNVLLSLLCVVGLLSDASAARAQGILVPSASSAEMGLPRPHYRHPVPPRPPWPRPRPVASYKITELDVNASLSGQVARVQVSQTFQNTGSVQMEVAFVFPLPYDGAVDQLTLLVDGKEFPAKLLDAAKARELYEAIVRRNQDPALLEWLGAGLFKTSVFPVPPGAKRTVTLRYSQLCRKQEGLTDFLFPLSTAKYTAEPVEKLGIRLTIDSRVPIKNLYSPTHDVSISRGDKRQATVTYEAKNTVPATDFRLLYDVGQGTVGAEVLSYRPSQDDDGYFLLLASPDIKAADQKPIPKTVVFVVDRSGSMSGEKIKQAREALKFVLNNLREGDLFNIVAYDSEISSFRPELQRYNDETRAAATAFVEGIYAGGSTNIDGALGVALDQLKDRERPSYVVFLTDGLPTAGETNEMRIAANARQNNRLDARIFSFGVGYDVNSRLLDRIVRDNHGQSEYVRPDQNIEEHVSRLYRRIESPVLTDVQIKFVLDEAGSKHGSAVNRVYPKGRFDLFAGEQLVVVGRYRTPGAAKVVLRGKIGDKEERFDFAAELVEKSADDSQGFVEKLWAVRRVGELIDEIDLKGRNEELVKELVDLSIRHGILTPYTSFMADDTMGVHDLARARGEAGRRLDELRVTDGRAGVGQRAYKGRMQQAARAPAAGSSPMSGESMGAGMGAGGHGFGGMGGALAEADREVQKAEQTIRQIGNRTFYLREGQWIDSTLDEKRQKNPTRIKQFSDEYFKLAGRHGRAVSQYLVFDEPVVLEVEGRAYLIEP